MPRYHNTENGPKLCSTSPSKCPISKVTGEPHFNTIENAQKAFEKKLEKEFENVSQKLTKKTKFLEPLMIENKFKDPKKYVRRKVAEWEEFESRIFPDKNSNLSEDSVRYLVDMVAGEIPEKVPNELTRHPDNDYSTAMGKSTLAHSLAQDCGYYAKITKDFSRKLAEKLRETHKDPVILDPMAGKGFFVKAMREQGVKTIGTDDKSWQKAQNDSNQIENIDALESLKKYGNQITHVMISWAPHESDIDYKILETVKRDFPHVEILNIGEAGGCTGSEKFWDAIDDDEDVEYLDDGGIYQTTVGLSDFLAHLKVTKSSI